MNLLLEHSRAFVADTFQQVIQNDSIQIPVNFLDEDGFPMEAQKNYKTQTGYKAIVDNIWNDNFFLIIKDGKTVGHREEAF